MKPISIIHEARLLGRKERIEEVENLIKKYLINWYDISVLSNRVKLFISEFEKLKEVE